MRLILLGLLLFAVALSPLRAGGQAVEGNEYRIVTQSGTVTLDAMLQELGQADVVFVGEEHDHALGHKLELAILEGLYAHTPTRALSMEMFERDIQLVLDEYLAGDITESAFLQAARPWPNYKTDYRPLVEFCKEKGLPVVAANAPRRYVNMVSRKGQEALHALPKASKTFLPPLPYSMDLPDGYDKQLTEIFGQAHDQPADKQATSGDHPSPQPIMPSVETMKQAQALWDATMQDSILHFLRTHRGRQVLQINGAMHSDYGYGIVDRLRKADPHLHIKIVSIKPDTAFPNVSWQPYAGMADFVIVTPGEAQK
jgi:uncharacterized iron-regulated protein